MNCGASFPFKPFPSAVKKGGGTYCSHSCKAIKNQTTHGHAARDSKSKTHMTWNAMKQRCNNPNHSKFAQYGALGITVCQRWNDSFEAFLEDMGERPDGMTIDRKDGTKGYSPENCKWSTPTQQQRNIKSNVMIEFRGQVKCLSEWAKIYGHPHNTLSYRLRSGWDTERAFMTPPAPSNRHAKTPSRIITLV